MYTMKQACAEVGMNYEALKFYCNEGLVPNVKRDKNQRRIFDDRDILWIKDLVCLKKCNMGIQEMKEYLALCLQGEATIPERQQILDKKRQELLAEREALDASLAYVDKKQTFYSDVLEGKRPYISNLIANGEGSGGCATL